jgi:hypothetical protein
LRSGQQLTLRRKNGGNSYEVLRGNARVTQRQLERSEALTMFTDPLGKKNLLGDHVFSQFASPVE